MLRIRKIVDLSHPLTADTPVYPGDPVPNISVATTIKDQGYNLFNIALGSQSGSHVDAPYHFRDHGATIDRVNLRHFMGTGLIIDVTQKAPMEQITVQDLVSFEADLKDVDIVLFRTDWYRQAGTSAFFDHPFLSMAGGEYLLKRGVQVAGIDTINLDKTGGTEFPIHDMFAEAGGIIAENLANLDSVDFASPFIVFLPLKLIGCDGSPVRAVAVSFES